MKKLLSIILSAIMLLSLTSCTKAEAAWQKKYDAGLRYLEDLEYESAIQSFNEAIQIDPKNENAYIALAVIYYEQGDADSATHVIDKATSESEKSAYLEKIKKLIENGTFDPTKEFNVIAILNNIVKCEKKEKDSGRSVIIEYDKDGNKVRETEYNSDGNISEEWIYNNKGCPVRFVGYEQDGRIYIISFTEYDTVGNVEKITHYRPDGSYEIITSDASGNRISEYFDADGKYERAEKFEYDEGILVRIICYDSSNAITDIKEYYANGNTMRLTSYSSFDGTISVSEYSEDGKLLYTRQCRPDGTIQVQMDYNSEIKHFRTTYYDSNGDIKNANEYDDNGKLVRNITYKNNEIVEIEEYN